MKTFYCIIILLVHISTAFSLLERVPNEVCTFSIGGHIYDLSELSKKDWKFSEVYHAGLGSKRHYFINICNSIKELKGCEDSNICFISTNNTNISSISYKSGGKNIEKSPIFMEDGHLLFELRNGSVCKTGRADIHYSTQLFLQCPLQTEEESYGPVLMSSSGCNFIFVWITRAACPNKHTIVKNSCIINLNDNSIDLNPLISKTYYSIKNNKFSFEMNICGPIANGSCPGNSTSICDISDINNPKPIAQLERESLDWNERKGIMDMNFNENYISTSIRFECDQKLMKPKISFKEAVISNIHSSYIFEIKTNLACFSTKSDCILRTSNDSIIDLRPLRRNESNWEIYMMNFDKESRMQLYLLNICGPLSNTGNNRCPSGPVGACKPSITDGASLNLGYVTSGPTISKDGSISILYTGGDPCRKDAQSSSTKIILVCSATQHLPVLMTVTSSCLHIFEWSTPTACPMGEIIGDHCKIEDPLHGEVFDLNPLRNKSADYFVTSEFYNFTINVCGPLLSDCNDRISSVCSMGNELKGSGKSPGSLVFDDGTILMEFDDGSNCNNGTWSSKIIFMCNHEAFDTFPVHLQTNEETCTHVFLWQTIHACPSFTSVDCFIHDKNNVYDLTPLSEPNDNWAFEIMQNGTSRKYIFNICRSIVHSKDFRCPYKAGSCLLESEYSKRALSLGNVVSSPYIENGTIMMHYTGGDLCTHVKRYETLIVFECVNWTYNSVPALIKEENCQTIITVPTYHACPKKLFHEKTGNCTITNTFTNYVYDFNSLRTDNPYEISYEKNSTIFLSVCSHLENKACLQSGSGSCLLNGSSSDEKVINMGVANSNLQFANWGIFLEYKGGDSCYSNIFGTLQQTTKISFVCSENNYISGPVIINYDRDACILYINWHTDLACERQINCFAKSNDNRVFSLLQLVKYFGNYEISNPNNRNTTYYINICKPLAPIKGIPCHPGSSACMVTDNSDDSRDISSLGHALIDPVVTSNDNVVLMYTHGSSCQIEGLSSSSLTSRITFICNRTVGVGTPVFIKQTHDCQVQFEWHTSLICPNEVEEDTHFGNQCQIYFEKAKANTDIMPLYKPGGYTVEHGNKKYKVNVCGAVCQKSGVCTEDGTSYGLYENANLNWESDMLKLSYYTGDPCTSSITLRRSSIIYFECDMNAGYGAPAAEPWNQEESCKMAFYWRTNVTCIEAIYKPEQTTLLPTIAMPINVPKTPVTLQPQTETLNSGNIGLSILVAVLALCLVLTATAVLFFRSMQGRRLTTQAKGFFRRKGYSNVFSQTENDNLLGGGSYVYRVDEDEQVLRV